MNDSPIVSIITPTYNHERLIGTCIESVIAQTFPDWEMFIVDDASPDGTADIVKGFDDPRIVYIRQEHVGAYRMAETYNRALARARGKYVAILEGDDFWPPYKLARQVPILASERDAVASYGLAGVVDDDGEPLGFYPRPALEGRYARPIHFLTERTWVQPVTLLIRRDALQRIGGFRGTERYPSVSLTTWLPLSLEGPFRFDNVVLGLWRRHQGQVTSSFQFNLRRAEIILAFARGLDRRHLDSLGIRMDDVVRASRRGIADFYWTTARNATAKGDWNTARDALRKVIWSGNWFRKAEATVMYAALTARLDVNGLIERAASTGAGRGLVRRQNLMPVDRNPRLLSLALAADGEVPNELV